MLAEPAEATALLERLRALGVRIAIDDFGTGYSSMAHLLTLPLDELKVDRTITGAIDQQSGRAIMGAIVELGHALGLTVVAEGVEDAATLETLRDLNCDDAQGYHLCAPIPQAQLLNWLLSHPIHVTDGESTLPAHAHPR